MKKATKKRLPNKLSNLILLALSDLEKVERSKKYTIDMNMWHSPVTTFGDYKGKCEVCFAGAVISQTLRVPPRKLKVPSDFDRATRGKLHALNSIRVGYINAALCEMELDGYAKDRYVPPYEKDPDGFKKELRSIAKELKGKGL